MPKASNLPEAWTPKEDTQLLLAAQRMGYYPHSATTRRGQPAESFPAKFMLLYTPIRVSHRHLALLTRGSFQVEA